ncbi:YkvA family protein [Exiguobacterium sp. s193]|uniref:YkvA family protein n=1 Tax=Exiguobacterium sp. s193 TaxID=2751207 RepID=UPI001BE5C83B|nr:YkvA family protein [Exiguobacterium sp. s193]
MDLSNEKLKQQQDQYAEEAKDYIDRPKKTKSILKRANNSIQKNSSLSLVFSPVRLFIDMVRSYQSGEYRDIRRTTILKVIGALIYLVSPIDLIPDFILGFGFADDIAIILFVTKTIFEELTRYSDWQDEQQKARTQPLQSEDAY